MPPISLKDILINARQESFRMQHFYIGAEHLFIGLLEIPGGLAASILEEYGLTAQYVVDAIRRHTGKGSRQRLWAGMPNTPRADMILSIANDLALEDNRDEINERDLLHALLEENDSVPVRVLRRLSLDSERIKAGISKHQTQYTNRQPYVKVDFSLEFDPAQALSEDHLFILRRMFYGYPRIRIDRRLTGGYTQALILVVTPIRDEDMEDAPVVVKIDHDDIILDEAQRYEQHVKASLPPLTARLEDKPTTAETSDLAGLKYTFVAGADSLSQNLRTVAHERGTAGLGDWLRDQLYPSFGRNWWQQRRPFRFQVWQEYDWLLPPLLTLDYIGEEEQPVAQVIREPIRRSRIKDLEYGALVAVEGFTVLRVNREKDSIQLALGKGAEAARRAYKIEVRGVNLAQDAYYRSEVIERLIGRVYKTRTEILLHAVSALEPGFDVRAETIPGLGQPERLPNPIYAHEDLLDRHVNGSHSKIHGDLHLGNILIGPNNSAFLIDFAHTRNGHTLFDWACLELSLLADVVMPVAGEDWAAARLVLRYLNAVHQGVDMPTGRPDLTEAMNSIVALRSIVSDCLASPNNAAEYYIALAMGALRATTWDTMSLPARRLMFLLSAQAIYELRFNLRSFGSLDTLTTEDSNLTEVNETD